MLTNPITAKVVAHSVAPEGQEIITWEVEQPKFINAEVNTHRMFSRNGSSSRAIPATTIITQVDENPYLPVDVRLNERGMQGYESAHSDVIDEFHKDLKEIQEYIAAKALHWADKEGMNIHKQHISRYLEPFMMQKFLITTTEKINWFKLRMASDAQPEIFLLADAMITANNESTPKKLNYGEWHLPYIEYENYTDLKLPEDTLIPSEAFVSAGCAAAVSYRNMPDVDKAHAIAKSLLESGHMSPFEHQATPLDPEMCLVNSHESPFADSHISVRLDGTLWGGNFHGWGQLRGIVEGGSYVFE